jgi:pimeloyl-ACP methyl ester carboxylesterase
MSQEVFELHALLVAAKVPGPFVLVGQSIGGVLVRIYADRYSSDVVGAALVDPLHESDMVGSVRFGGWVRLREKATERPVPEPRREGKPSTQYNPEDDYLAEGTAAVIPLTERPIRRPLGSRPLIVLAAGKRPAATGYFRRAVDAAQSGEGRAED